MCGDLTSPANPSIAVTIETPVANRIGDDQLLRELGRGGLGVVYESKHMKRGNRVAQKILPSGADGQSINIDRLYKFRRDFRSKSEINHPNLIGMLSLEIVGRRWFSSIGAVILQLSESVHEHASIFSSILFPLRFGSCCVQC